MIINCVTDHLEEDFWTWAETHPVRMLCGSPLQCQPHWSQKDRKWFQDSWKALHGTKFFKELSDGTLVSWDDSHLNVTKMEITKGT